MTCKPLAAPSKGTVEFPLPPAKLPLAAGAVVAGATEVAFTPPAIPLAVGGLVAWAAVAGPEQW